MSHEPVLTSRDIGITENALRALLLKNLAGTGLGYHTWVALQAVAKANAPLAYSDLVHLLKDGLKIEDAAANAALDELRTAGMVTFDGHRLSATADGAALFERVNTQTRQLSQQIYAGLPAEDLVVAHRVLATLAARANAALAA